MTVVAQRESHTPHRGRRLALSFLCVFLLPLALVVRTTPPASAFAPAVPLVVGPAVAASPAVTAGVVTCAASVICGGAVILGVAAYATKDLWMPAVEGLFNPTYSSIRTDGSSGCLAGMTPAQGGLTAPSYSGGVFSFNWTGPPACYSGFEGYSPTMTLEGTLRCIQVQAHATRSAGDIFVRSSGQQARADRGGGTIYNVTPASVNLEAQCGAEGGAVAEFSYSIWHGIFGDTQGGRGKSLFAQIRPSLPPAANDVTTTTHCLRPDGSTFSRSSVETGLSTRLMVPACRDADNGGDPASIPTGVDVKTGPFDTDHTTLTIPDVRQDFPNCFASSGLVCTIEVTIDGLPCTGGVWLCRQWQYQTANPRLACQFGAYVIPWEHCAPLKRSYPNPNPSAPPQPGPEPLPNPSPWPDAEPEPEPTPSPSPSPSPSTSPNPSPSPSASPSASPSPSPSTPPSPTDPGDNPDPGDGSGSCMGDGFTWNPVSWVYTPVKCAFIWAFVPRTPFSTRINRIKTTFANVVPFSWFGPIAAFGDLGLPGSGGCPDWRIDISTDAAGSTDKNVVCGNSYTNAIRDARPLLAGGMLMLAFWPLIRGLMFASIPILKPTPTDGGGR